MLRKIVSTLLAALLAAMCLTTPPALADTAPSIQLTSVPKLGETQKVKGTVFLGDLNPKDYVVIAIVGGNWPKPYFDSYRNKLTASEKGYATFGFSVTTGGQDASYNTFTLYLCEAALFENVNAASVTDAFMQNRYVLKMVVDKTAFNAPAQPPQPSPAPAAEPYAFLVYDDAPVHYGDIAFMGSRDNGNDGSMAMDTGCTDTPHSGSHCIRITYAPPSSNHWAGMMWLSGADNFPPNLPVEGVDTAQVSQLSFYARGQGSTKFFIENENRRQVTLTVRLTPEWTPYALAIPSDWENVCVGFGFASSGAAGQATIDLDDIAFGK